MEGGTEGIKEIGRMKVLTFRSMEPVGIALPRDKNFSDIPRFHVAISRNGGDAQLGK